MHIDIDYKNHSGFISCFILQLIELDRPDFLIKDTGLILQCQKAFILPDFGELLKRRAILLKCMLLNAHLANIEEVLKNNKDIAEFLRGDLLLLREGLRYAVFDTIQTKLRLYHETIEFISFKANSKDVKIYASGMLNESGDFNINAKIFFSQTIVKRFPEELTQFLTRESRGWLSYSISAESGQNKPSLKLESDRFRINFEKVEIK